MYAEVTHPIFFAMTKLKTRKQLEKYIKKRIPFYQWVDLSGHSDEQLREVIERDKKENKMQLTK